jgi:hypothetical protein
MGCKKQIMTLFKLTVTDEFHQQYVFESENRVEIIDRVTLWLTHLDKTPIYEIHIEVN